MQEQAEIYPNECYRGISSKDGVTPGGYVTGAAFQFSDYKPEQRNGDGFCELSIQWNDDENASVHLLEQRKPKTDNLQFKIGYCKLDMEQLRLVVKQYLRDKKFAYERRPIEEDAEEDIRANPYHGNLLLHNSIERQVRKNIEHTIAGMIEREDVFLRTDKEDNNVEVHIKC